MKKANLNLIYFLIYFSGLLFILSLPLLKSPLWFQPASWGKAIVFRIIFSILISLFVYQILFKKQAENFFTIVRKILDRKDRIFLPFWLLIALLLVFFLATLFSKNPFFSFWGSPYRGGGFLNFSLYIVFALFVFLVFKKYDWKILWGYSFFIGLMVSFIAISQQFHLFSKHIIPSFGGRPVSTFGNPIFLSIYLLILWFVALSYEIKAKSIKEHIFYILCLGVFLFTILISQTRSAYLGLFFGLLYFAFCYKTYSKKIKKIKISFLIILIFAGFGFYFVRYSPPLFPDTLFQKIINRISSINLKAGEARISGWKIAVKGIKEKSVLGYGPENFSIPFDKYYDPSLPGLSGETEENWWDRAHNFIFDIATTTGLLGLFVYLSLIAVLFLKLQKAKKENPENYLFCHTAQSAFIGYLTANLFGFDSFSTYLIFFFLVGFSLFLLQKQPLQKQPLATKTKTNNGPAKQIFYLVFLCFIVFFIIFYNIRPLKINKEINLANYAKDKGKCPEAIQIMEKTIKENSIIDHYLRLNYINIIGACISLPDNQLPLGLKAIQILEENTKIRPNYTRNWLFWGGYANFLVEAVPQKLEKLNPGLTEKYKKQALFALEKAFQLSPKRQKIIAEMARAEIINGNYQKAVERTEECIKIKNTFVDCWWKNALANIYLGNFEKADKAIEKVKELGYDTESKKSLVQLLQAYIAFSQKKKTKEVYKRLAEIYEKAIALDPGPGSFQYYASLAYVYKVLGEYQKAKEKALKVLEFSPESKKAVEEFLKTLPE